MYLSTSLELIHIVSTATVEPPRQQIYEKSEFEVFQCRLLQQSHCSGEKQDVGSL